MSFGGFDKENNKLPMAEINMTPLVDVMLVLLIIFMVTTPLITNTNNVNLPKTTSLKSKEDKKYATIAIDEKGQIFWNKEMINDEQLSINLSEYASSNNDQDKQIRLEADLNTRYEEIAKIMTEVKRCGIEKLGFVTKKDK